MRDGVGLDGAAVRVIAEGLADSAAEIDWHARACRAVGFGPDAAGDRYRSEAEVVRARYDGLHRAVAEWSAATAARAEALRRAAGGYAWLERVSESVLRAVDLPPTGHR
ncbi:hypothetical protein [Rhodococcus aetherivorans]|uniref:hypothetical protein n=1 Tax=Rhodococcus aetherivorans TaxID=191292 RepID=UPI0003E2C4E0|nr:hypothetical protein [Rhodococcus aetherivorans]ETT23509.1 hypothetical protein RR21198_5390 [Rhodococcus rhodochrous ATCC 21198]MDV6296619.1 hypothetical protein [Rhodococcus aetherivorans]